jgi:predicted Zn-dependent protease
MRHFMTTVSTVSSYSRGRGLMLLAAVVAVIVLIVLYGGRDDGMPGGGERFVTLTVAQEITLGQQALPELAVLYGGVTPNAAHQALGARVGQHIASQGLPKKTGYRFGFTVLGDDTVLDAFALPGGQVAITDGMVNRMKTEGQLAAVLALQIAHVMSRHPTELLATNSANDPKANPDASLQERFSSFSAQLSAMKFTPAQVLEADRLAVVGSNHRRAIPGFFQRRFSLPEPNSPYRDGNAFLSMVSLRR